jgi:DNA-binding CsgD family transcriptional regulator
MPEPVLVPARCPRCEFHFRQRWRPAPSPADVAFAERFAARLAPRQIACMALLLDGLPNRGIGERLGISEQVAKNYLRDVYDLAGVSDRLELALFLVAHPALYDLARSTARSLPPRAELPIARKPAASVRIEAEAALA